MTRVLIRADASPDIGAGHIVRMLAFAREMRARDAEVIFATSVDSFGTIPFLGAERNTAVTLHGLTCEREVDELSAKVGHVDIIAIDNYRCGADYETACRRFADTVLAFDDRPLRKHDCDILVDPTFARRDDAYRDLVPSHATVLCGSQYVLLRKDFADARNRILAQRRSSPAQDIRCVSIAFGASRTESLVSRAIEGCGALRTIRRIDVLTGTKSVAVPTMDRGGIEVRFHPVNTSVSALMESADIAIGAAGTMAFERCCLGLPSLMVCLVDNQIDIARNLHDAGAALLLGNANDCPAERFSEGLLALAQNRAMLNAMRERAVGVCDGRGAQRVADRCLRLRQKRELF